MYTLYQVAFSGYVLDLIYSNGYIFHGQTLIFMCHHYFNHFSHTTMTDHDLIQPLDLPSGTSFLSTLISHASSAIRERNTTTTRTGSAEVEPHHVAETKAKAFLLALHTIYPKLLLPALDIIDRRLIYRVIAGDEELDGRDVERRERHVYFVRSASTEMTGTESESRPLTPTIPALSILHSQVPDNDGGGSEYGVAGTGQGIGYEVRLDAWNCTCPAFTLEALSTARTRYSGGRRNDVDWFGGRLARDAGPDSPMCKHLLACLLWCQRRK